MKYVSHILITALLVSCSTLAYGQAFITTWKTDNAGSSNSTSITIPTFGGGYDYHVDWNNDNIYEDFNVTGDITHDFGTAGTYTIRIKGVFPRIYFNNTGDKLKLISVEEWGVQPWQSFENAFYGCSNLTGSPVDNPDLSSVTSLKQAFYNASDFNMDIGGWDVSTIESLYWTFSGASSFDQDLNGWNVGSVTNMSGTFRNTTSFNSDIASWNTENVLNMSFMFNGSSFNDDISGWDVSSVTTMASMFKGADDFNQPLNAWTTTSLTNVVGMFQEASSFNQELNNWNLSSVNSLKGMFNQATDFNGDISGWNVSNIIDFQDCLSYTSFNRDISGWNVSAAQNMGSMFAGASDFNQDIGGWDTGNVLDMEGMFDSASSFDQDIGGWDVSNVNNMSDMFLDATLSIANYDALLIGWDTQVLQTGVNFSGGNSQYCTAGSKRQAMIDDHSWSITDGGLSCGTSADDFVTTWKTDNPGATNSTSITIPLSAGTYNYDVDWDNDGTFDQLGLTSNVVHDFGTAGTYTIRIRGDFPRIAFAGISDKDKLVDIVQWGNIEWTSMAKAFEGCTNLNISATDAPDLDLVTDMNYMFAQCENLNADLSSWDLSNVEIMSSMFLDCYSFNGNISTWNVGNVTTMSSMFNNCQALNQDLNLWNVGNVELMNSMFAGADGFTGNISNWNVGNVTNMTNMFSGATDFNADISGWNVGSVESMSGMFKDANQFNQNLNSWNTSSVSTMRAMFKNAFDLDQKFDGWDVTNVTDMFNMFENVTLSTDNYDALITGWSSQALQNSIDFHGGNSIYCASTYDRIDIIDNDLWSITDGGECLTNHFVITVNTTNTGTSGATSFTIPVNNLYTYNYSVDWDNDGTLDQTGITGSITHDFGSSGSKTIRISGYFPAIMFNDGGDKNKLISVDQWGIHEWQSMLNAFNGCENFQITATDEPDLSDVTSMQGMFKGATLFNSPLNSWDVSNVTSMTELFRDCSNFAQDLNNWDVSNVTAMNGIFQGCSTFDNNISSWNVGNVTTFNYAFSGATIFNQPIGSWNMSSAQSFSFMFAGAILFNQPIDTWNVSNVTNMGYMFQAAGQFNQDLNSWDVSNVTVMVRLFYAASEFNGDISDWDVGSVITMNRMLGSCVDFNHDISGWDVSSVTNMGDMFNNAQSFDQNIGSWDVSNVTIMTDMFKSAELSVANYDALLAGWDAQSLNSGISFHGGNSQYCNSYDERQNMINNDSWTIVDGGDACTTNYFITRWNVTAGDVITIPTVGGFYNYEVDWENSGTWESGFTGDASHTYTTTGIKTILIRGDFPRIYFDSGPMKDKILSVEQWGNINWSSMYRAFKNCSNLVINATDAPNLSNCTTLQEMFQGCTNLSGDIDHWNVSNIENMKFTFTDCSNFNSELNSWNVSNVNNMQAMFNGCTIFNQDLDNWNTTNVDFINQMFSNATAFNGNISTWDVSGVRSMYFTFAHCTNFNGDLSLWRTFSNQTMQNAFLNCVNYNQPMADWKVANVENMNGAFRGCTIFNQPIEDWNTSKVLTFENMFHTATAFNQPLNWDVSAATSMQAMFQDASSFNGDITSWIPNAGRMRSMFSGASSFNQPIGVWSEMGWTWDMQDMFRNAFAFDQDISAWNISNVTNFTNFLYGATLSTAHYDALLLAWEPQNPNPSLNFSGGFSKYCAGEPARTDLINDFNWTITDGGPDDSEAPTITCPDGITVNVDDGLCTASGVNLGSPLTNDNCFVTTVSNNAVEPYAVGNNTVTWTVLDGAGGNSNSCDQIVTVIDNIAPNAICQNYTTSLASDGTLTLTGTEVNNGSSDNCSLAPFVLTPNTFNGTHIGDNDVVLTVSDPSGNSETCNAVVSIVDSENPDANCQTVDVIVELNENGIATITATDIDNGSTDNVGIDTLTLDIYEFTCADKGDNDVELTVTDFAGLSSTCIANVVVEDNIPATPVCQDITVYLDENGTVTITESDVDNGSFDNCLVTAMGISSAETFTADDLGENITTLVVKDGEGVELSCESIVTVVDSITPSAVCQNVDLILDNNGNASLTAQDVDNGSSDNTPTTTLSINQTDFTCDHIGENTTTLTVTDMSGLSSTCDAVVTVSETTNPTALCQPFTLSLDDAGNAIVDPLTINNGSTDNCDITSYSTTPSSFNASNLGDNNITLTVADASGNSAECSTTITIVDTTAPTAVCQDVSIDLDSSGLVSITAADVDNGSFDNVGVTNLSIDITDYDCSTVGDNTVILSATDNAGQTGTCTAVVTVNDLSSPTALCQDIDLYYDANGLIEIDPADVNNNSFDDCGIESMSVTPDSFTGHAANQNTVELTVVDFGGNISTCTANVLLIDTISPIAVCQPITVELDANGQVIIDGSAIAGSSTDNLTISTYTPSIDELGCDDLGITAITVTVSDFDGNSSVCNAQVTLENNQVPVLECQNITASIDSSGFVIVSPEEVVAVSAYNCETPILTLSDTLFSCEDIGNHTVTLSSSTSGFNNTCQAIISIIDSIPPIALCQDTSIAVDGAGNTAIAASVLDDGSYDGCGISQILLTQYSFTADEHLGDNDVTLYVTDNYGNTSTCTSNVNIYIDPNMPTCASTNYIEDEYYGLPLDDDLTWTPVDNANGYYITIGTTPGGNDIADGLDLGNYAGFSPEDGWEHTTNYYYTVNPYNEYGTAAGCPQYSFESWNAGREDLYIPKYFTPNGDGINDTWQINYTSFVKSIIIYDRYGKVLKNLDPESEGWDGFYNGYELPEDDYWYKIILKRFEVIQGHFSLIKK